MMLNKKLIVFVMALTLILDFSFIGFIPVSAHSNMLDVKYDDCDDDRAGDGIDEMWYILENDEGCRHISHQETTIKYFFEDDPNKGGCWTVGGISASEAELIKAAIAESMEKWNNVCFYKYNADGTITKNKLIEVVEVERGEKNLTIFPVISNDDIVASTGTAIGCDDEVETGHTHSSQWGMFVNLNHFYAHDSITVDYVNLNKEKTGAHEIGHILGLRDIEELCGANSNSKHHLELLMGYGEPQDILQACSDITYKDIAGVAITRGFHTDDDHKWLRMEQSGGTYKYVCSICNGIPNDSNFTPSSYDTYGRCGGAHSLSRGNMMAVASYENKDYYKCKYCRYVESFANIPTQNYEKCYYSSELHKCVNTVDGLEYFYYEPHTLVDGECTECTPHRYDYCVYLNQLSHQFVCACGETGGTGRHYVTGGNGINRFVPCAGCGYLLDMRDDIHEGIMSITQVSVNGSYIRADGIVVLVDEDIEAYLAGTLQFYHPEDVPVTQ